MNAADINAMAEAVVINMKRAIDPLKQRLEAAELRLATLESKPHVKFCGVWKSGQTYAPGDAATHHGGLWIAKTETAGEPSKDFAGWQLAVKRGGA